MMSRLESLLDTYSSSSCTNSCELIMRLRRSNNYNRRLVRQRCSNGPPLQKSVMLRPMSLSRRQFFRRFWNPSDKSNPRRTARYEELKSYVRTCCLPYDFSLTEWENAELFAEVQIVLESATDEE